MKLVVRKPCIWLLYLGWHKASLRAGSARAIAFACRLSGLELESLRPATLGHARSLRTLRSPPQLILHGSTGVAVVRVSGLKATECRCLTATRPPNVAGRAGRSRSDTAVAAPPRRGAAT